MVYKLFGSAAADKKRVSLDLGMPSEGGKKKKEERERVTNKRQDGDPQSL